MHANARLVHRSALGAGLLFATLTAVLAVPTVSSIPFAPNGDSIVGSAGAPVALSPSATLIAAEGADGNATTADDVTLLVTGVGSAPVVTPLATPFLSDFSGHVERLSATRALEISAGADGKWKTADDQLFLLDRLGSQNLVTPLVIGGLNSTDAFAPVALTASSAVVSSLGPDLAPNTADDKVVLITGVGSTNTRTDVNVPRLFTLAAGRPVRVSATRALVNSAGADAEETTADDELMLLDRLGSTNTVTPIPIPNLHDFGAGMATPLTNTLALVSTEGPDSMQSTADDVVAVISDLGGANTVTPLTLGGGDEDQESRATRLTPTSAALATGGGDAKMNTADDELVILTGVGTTNTVTRVPMPGLAPQVTSVVVAVSSTAFLVSSGGQDGAVDAGLDDIVSLVSGTGGAPLVESVPAGGEFNRASLPCVAQLLGRGRAVLVSSGPDGTTGAGGDDLMRVIEGLPLSRSLSISRAALRFRANHPAAGENLSVSGRLNLDDRTLLAGTDITISVGNAAQTIPASAIKKQAGAFQYRDPRGHRGFLRSVTLDPKHHRFQIVGRSVGTGAQTTSAGYVPVAIEGEGFYLPDVVAGKATSRGIFFP